ncbi:MerR family transcriptional regulator [Listeria booriae]|uniref:MerR family transcriptional regulator n=1 Tax=Listeria booriae TaxID=1552123 RepID=A0A841VX57_9LIST|nr:MerR family transcriptional regulator [Listeria booriae]MBC1210622.1 MerR family transcriptional regulator [Listeria booriae]MBC1228273.1 MerR family transcriptional regulator [Listeria booriae]MBC1271474.1 MerR family transcriptional regulator [Listeria booriae]MBC1317349.1 MerR family transcriptional regulator [Listeria booriae]
MYQTYSIKDVAAYFDISISSIRFYDKNGLLPFVSKNESGHRVFTESDMNFIHTICCLKNTGMPIKDIKRYIQLCMNGPNSISERKTMLQEHKAHVLREQEKLQENLKEIDIKIARYDSKNATSIIQAQIQYVTAEKKAHDMPNPFHV